MPLLRPPPPRALPSGPRPPAARIAVNAQRDKPLAEVGQFLVAGALAYAADVALFNTLAFGFDVNPTLAKITSSGVGIAVAYLGNRYLTWRDQPPANVPRAVTVFFVLSVMAAFLQLLCLWTGHLFHLHGALADNLTSNVIGMGAAMIFRFWSFRRFVFTPSTAA